METLKHIRIAFYTILILTAIVAIVVFGSIIGIILTVLGSVIMIGAIVYGLVMVAISDEYKDEENGQSEPSDDGGA